MTRCLLWLLLGLVLVTAGCATHTSNEDPVRVMVVWRPELRTCRYVSSDPSIRIALGERSIPRFERALGKSFVIVDAADDADVLALPRIASAQPWGRISLGRAEYSVEYGVELRAPSGERITDVTVRGTGLVEPPVLVTIVRTLLHIGTLLLFSDWDTQHQASVAFGRAEDEAERALTDALRGAIEVHTYTRRARGGQHTPGADEEVDLLLDRIVGGRNLAVAVLDLAPIAGDAGMIESYLGEELRTRLAQRPGVRTFERALLAHALTELRISASDLVDPLHARRFGRMVAADSILTGTTVHFPAEVKANLRLLDTETGRVIGAGSAVLPREGFFRQPINGGRMAACPFRP